MFAALTFAAGVLLLDAADFRAREAGSIMVGRAVRSHPAAVGPALDRLLATHPSAEARSRLARLTGPYRAHLADTYAPPPGVPVWPDLYAVPETAVPDWPAVIGRWRCDDNWVEIPPGECPTWEGRRRMTERMVRHQIRTGELTPAGADWLVWRAWENEGAQVAESVWPWWYGPDDPPNPAPCAAWVVWVWFASGPVGR